MIILSNYIKFLLYNKFQIFIQIILMAIFIMQYNKKILKLHIIFSMKYFLSYSFILLFLILNYINHVKIIAYKMYLINYYINIIINTIIKCCTNIFHNHCKFF